MSLRSAIKLLLPPPLRTIARNLFLVILRYYRPLPMNRREFLKRCVVATGGVGGVSKSDRLMAIGAAPSVVRATDVIRLGPEKIEVTRLALGSGSNGRAGSSNQTRRLGMKGYPELLREAFDVGIRFWDSADVYGSHPHLGAALKVIPREKVAILTKTFSRTAKEVRADIDRFRRELNTDYIDILLLHCLTDPQWRTTMRPVMDVISEAKARGIIRSHGVSCHSFEALKAAAEEPWVEIDMARINPAGVKMDSKVDEVVPVLQRMHGAGKGVIGMKIYGAGQLTKHRVECLRFTFGLGCIPAITLGIESRQELHDALREIEIASVAN